MKKCLKCGNNVLPGTSTCPGCGNPIKNNTNIRQAYTPRSNTSGRTVLYNTTNNKMVYTSNNGSSAAVFVAVFMILVFLSVIGGVVGMFSEIENEFHEETVDYTENDSILESDLHDYVKVNNVVVSENGEIAMFLENTYSEQLSVDMDLKYLDENGSELSGRFGIMNIAPGEEQVLVFTKLSFVYRSYKYGYDVEYSKTLDSATTIDLDKIVTINNGEKLVATYTNNGENDLKRVELCVFYYDNETLKYVDCRRDYDIAKGEDLVIEFDYSSRVKFYGLNFNRYEYYLHEAEKE